VSCRRPFINYISPTGAHVVGHLADVVGVVEGGDCEERLVPASLKKGEYIVGKRIVVEGMDVFEAVACLHR
jgi:hypothetical protein